MRRKPVDKIALYNAAIAATSTAPTIGPYPVACAPMPLLDELPVAAALHALDDPDVVGVGVAVTAIACPDSCVPEIVDVVFTIAPAELSVPWQTAETMPVRLHVSVCVPSRIKAANVGPVVYVMFPATPHAEAGVAVGQLMT